MVESSALDAPVRVGNSATDHCKGIQQAARDAYQPQSDQKVSQDNRDVTDGNQLVITDLWGPSEKAKFAADVAKFSADVAQDLLKMSSNADFAKLAGDLSHDLSRLAQDIGQKHCAHGEKNPITSGPSKGAGDASAPSATSTGDTSAPPATGTGDTSAPPATGTGDASAPPATGAGDTSAPPATGTGDASAPSAPTDAAPGKYPDAPSALKDLGSVRIQGNDINALKKLGNVSENPDGTLVLDAAGKQLPQLDLNGVKGLTIENAVFANTRFGISVESCNAITIKNSRFESTGEGVAVHASSNVHVDGNYFHNMQGPYPQASAVQFDHGSGNNSISNNQMVNELGHNHMEDVINIFASDGTFTIDGNALKGSGGSPSGAAITLGDYNSKSGGGIGNYFVRNNTVDFASGDANGGIQIVGGNADVEGNTVRMLDPVNGGASLMIYRYQGSNLGDLTVKNNQFLGTNPKWVADGIPINGLETNTFASA